MTYRKKLIEVALPLEAINKESAREKSIRHGHPSTLHLWWARRPLATCRAVLFASLVDDPSSRPEEFPTEEAQERERQRLFRLIEELVLWENSSNESVLARARKEIMRSTDGNPPPFLDPFAGGGSIPLEAQRLGLEAHASDLNPVAVLINKALIEIPATFAGQPPINPTARKKIGNSNNWKGAQGLAEDVSYYGKWMRDEAEKRVGRLYPKVQLPKEYGGGESTVVAWLWTRTVRCPNPACGARSPLVRSFTLSIKKGKQAWVEPIIDRAKKTVQFEVRTGSGTPPEGTVNRRGARCLVCGSPVPFDYIRIEGKSGRLSAQMMAIVAEIPRGRVYLSPIPQQESIAAQARPVWTPETDLPEQALGFRVQLYGMTKHRDLFSPRQLVALTTFCDLVGEARTRIRQDAQASGLNVLSIDSYADAVATYLAFAISKVADRGSTLTRWMPSRDSMYNTFARQALPMVWDYVEVNAIGEQTGGLSESLRWTVESLEAVGFGQPGQVFQRDAASSINNINHPMISTDPPYYDNIGYADLSDFFYVWLRHSIGQAYPDIFGTLLVPR